MFTYLDIQQIIGEADKDYRTLHGFTEKIFLNAEEDLNYLGSRGNKVFIDIENLERKKSFSEPKVSLKKAVIHCHDKIFESICVFAEGTDEASAENAAGKLKELVKQCPSAHAFVGKYVFLRGLNAGETLAVLFYIAMLAASDAFCHEMSAPQFAGEVAFKKHINKHFPKAEFPSDEELTAEIKDECSGIPLLGQYIMGYVSSSEELRRVHGAIFAGERFFDLFSVPRNQREMLRSTPFPEAAETAKELFSDAAVRRTLELMLFFSEYRMETEVLRKIDGTCVSALMTLTLRGVIKEVSPGRVYRPSYVWLFYLDELCGLLHRNALYYAEDFPVLPKLCELGRDDLLRNALVQLDFSEAVPLEEYIRRLLDEFPHENG